MISKEILHRFFFMLNNILFFSSALNKYFRLHLQRPACTYEVLFMFYKTSVHYKLHMKWSVCVKVNNMERLFKRNGIYS